MSNEYMPEYRPVDKRALAASLPNVKWGLVVMAVFCFAWSVYMYLTPPFGGAGILMITPENGPAGLVTLLPWCAIVVGAASALGTALSRGAWVLGWVEPLLSILALVGGVVGIYSSAQLGAFGTVYTIAGVYLAVYIVAIALEMYRRGENRWYVELALAVVVWIIAMAGGLNFAAEHTQVVFAALSFFIAAWGFVYGALKLHGAREQAAQGANAVA